MLVFDVKKDGNSEENIFPLSAGTFLLDKTLFHKFSEENLTMTVKTVEADLLAGANLQTCVTDRA